MIMLTSVWLARDLAQHPHRVEQPDPRPGATPSSRVWPVNLVRNRNSVSGR